MFSVYKEKQTMKEEINEQNDFTGWTRSGFMGYRSQESEMFIVYKNSSDNGFYTLE